MAIDWDYERSRCAFPQPPRDERPLDAELDTQTHRITVTLTEEQATALAGGYVSNSVKSMLRELLDWELEDERRAARPVKGKQWGRS